MFAVLDAPDRTVDPRRLRICVSGGAPLPVEVMKDFGARSTASILEGYGLSETSPVAAFNHPDGERKAGSIGRPIEGVEMQVVDEDGGDSRRARSARSSSAATT